MHDIFYRRECVSHCTLLILVPISNIIFEQQYVAYWLSYSPRYGNDVEEYT